MADGSRAERPGADSRCPQCERATHPDTGSRMALTHPSFRDPVVADAAFVSECGGPRALAGNIASRVGDPAAVPLPLRFAFARGRGEDYRLHVAYLYRDGHSVVVRRFRQGDPVVARVRLPRSRRPEWLTAVTGER